ncbi:hypothetical protein [Algiphilus aromaticivorans]|uniref:hypothetical protein n=1 Tax=Algiphilus aromaticivorans TaxID=382454 RepID=UPI0012EB7DEC|nr:hypothetical protein [Algiphilus aromaticivorans]
MFNNFETTKQQLSELAEVVNKFKSEAVQLKLLELLFDASPNNDDDQGAAQSAPKPKKRARKKPASTKSAAKPDKGAKRSSSYGPATILTKLYNEGFFSKPKTITEICEHSGTKLARNIKPNEISGKLGRMVRSGELSREKNSDNQYEYTKP